MNNKIVHVYVTTICGSYNGIQHKMFIKILRIIYLNRKNYYKQLCQQFYQIEEISNHI